MKVLSAGCGGWGHFTVGQFTDFSQRKKRRIKRKGYRYLSIRKWKAV